MQAFPGAEGFGANTVGGRGGTVYIVTNLNDSGAGSLREACEASGARIVVFAIGGTITCLTALKITNPNITIAGQTAPGGGITLKANPSDNEDALYISADEVIVRYIRMRCGAGTLGGDQDALDLYKAGYDLQNIILDHCSISWAVDGVADITKCSNVTVQWCIISEGLYDSVHSQGPHSTGMLLGATGTTKDISVLHNLFAHNDERSPRLKVQGTVDVVNNVIYNPGVSTPWGASHFSDNSGQINYIGNYLKPGVDTDITAYYISGGGTGGIYVEGNITPDHPDPNVADELTGVVRAGQHGNAVGGAYAAGTRTILSASAAYTAVLADAGCSSRLKADGTLEGNRDAVDDRIISDVEDVTGSIIDDPSDVGGWPTLAAGTAYTDSDSDGMADEWEDLNGFDKSDPTDGPALDRSGYSNVELFLNGIVVPQSQKIGDVGLVTHRANLRRREFFNDASETNNFWRGYFEDVNEALRGSSKLRTKE